MHGIRPDELVRLTPKLNPYLQHPNPTWPDIVDAADWLRHDLGVSKSLWGNACLTMGRELAAVALAIVSTKDEEHFRSSPGGYFHGSPWYAGQTLMQRASPQLFDKMVRLYNACGDEPVELCAATITVKTLKNTGSDGRAASPPPAAAAPARSRQESRK